MNLKVFSSSPEQTLQLGGQIASGCRGDELILLQGELGSGKTLLTKGIFREFSVPAEEIVSPTFTIMNRYQAAEHQLFHIDLYRLENIAPISELAEIDDYLESGIIAVEWAQYLDKSYFQLPGTICIQLQIHGENTREITLDSQREECLEGIAAPPKR